jgi:LysM repeat protein
MSCRPIRRPAGFATRCSALALAAVLAGGSAQAADTGARAHAKGEYDTLTATYVVVEGDDLFAISERFEVPVDELKAHNKLTSNEVKPGEKIHVAAGAAPATAHPAAPHKAAAKKPLAKMTCEDFVGLDESFQPKAVYWAVAYGKGGKPEAEEVAVEGVETVVPLVVQECKKAPKESFWEKVKAQWKKVEARL